MKSYLFIITCFLCISEVKAQDSTNAHKIYLEIGFNGGIYSNSFTGGAYGAAGIFFSSFGKKSALDFRAKENYIVSPEREAGAITVTYRMYITKAYYLGGGFAHNHEIAFKSFVDDPARAILGNSKNIIHRSGLAIETGYDFKSLLNKDKWGLYPVTNICLEYFMLDEEPNPFITLSIGLRFGFKKYEGNAAEPVK